MGKAQREGNRKNQRRVGYFFSDLHYRTYHSTILNTRHTLTQKTLVRQWTIFEVVTGVVRGEQSYLAYRISTAGPTVYGFRRAESKSLNREPFGMEALNKV